MPTNSQQPQVDAHRSDAAASASAQLHRSAQRLAEQAVRLYRWRSGLWWLASALLATIVLIASDYGLHVEEAGLRWLVSLVWLTALAVAAWRFFPPAWRFTLGPVHVAEWIERGRPELRGRLSNTLAIAELPSSDLRFGSEAFRRAALQTVDGEPLAIDWRSYLDRRPTWLAVAGVLSLILVAAGLTFTFPQIAGRGTARLLRPWHSLPWPQADELRLVNLPTMIASGSELPIEVIDDRPPLPTALELQILATDPDQPDGPKRLVRLPMRVLQNVALATVTDMRSDFAVRAVGGDDQDAAWSQVRVAELPELLDQQFHVSPPAYSRQPAAELVGERIEVLSGSKVSFHGRYSSRMRSITAQGVSGAPASEAGASEAPGQVTPSADAATQAADGPASWPAALSVDRQAFDLFQDAEGGLVVDVDRRWRLRVETEDGLTVTEPKIWSIHVVADRPPTVNLVPIEPALVTRDSVVNIVGQATDDLELVEVQLVWQAGDEGEARRQTLWSSASAAAAPANSEGPDAPAATPASDRGPAQRQTTVDLQWRPGEERLPLAQPVSIYLEARDSLGQVTRSVTQTIEIQDAQTVLAHLQAEEAKTFEPLRQLLGAQRRNEQSVKRTRDIVHESEALTAEQLDALSTARQLQQSLAQQLAHSPTSILDKLEALGGQLQRNALANTELAKQVERLTEEIKRMDAEGIPALKTLDNAQQAIRTALEASSADAEKANAAAQLEKAAASQHAATTQLSRLVDSIAAAETVASLQKQFSDLERRQNELRTETERLQVERVAHPESKSADATRIGLRSDQLSLARDVDDLLATIDEQLQQPTETQEPAHSALEKARQALVDQQVSQTMRDAAEKVDAEQLAEAIKAQRAAASAIARAATQFGGSSTATLESTSANLQAMAEQLGGLADQQTGLADAMRNPAAAQKAEELAEQQAQLAESAAALSAELEKQSNPSLSEQVAEGQQQAEKAADQAAQANLAQAAESAQRAADEFRQAEQLAQRRVSDLKQQLATQQLLDLRAAVDDLLRRQTPIVERLKQLQTSSAATDQTADGTNQLRDAAAAQEVVRQQLLETSSRMQELDTFAWLLGQCELDMARAVAALERQQLEPDGLASAASALRKLNAAAQALVPPEPGSAEDGLETDDSQPPNEEPNDAEGDTDATERRPSMASLKLLRALQNAINEETQALQAQGEDAQGLEMLRLADEQQELAEQTQKLMQDILNKK